MAMSLLCASGWFSIGKADYPALGFHPPDFTENHLHYFNSLDFRATARK